jgi:hypothetical protein
MFLDIQKKYNEIEQDIIENEKDIFLRYNYFSKKYKGDRLNDVNVGLFLNDNLEPVAQIFVRNKTGYIKKHIIFNREGNKILNTITLNYKIN